MQHPFFHPNKDLEVEVFSLNNNKFTHPKLSFLKQKEQQLDQLTQNVNDIDEPSMTITPLDPSNYAFVEDGSSMHVTHFDSEIDDIFQEFDQEVSHIISSHINTDTQEDNDLKAIHSEIHQSNSFPQAEEITPYTDIFDKKNLSELDSLQTEESDEFEEFNTPVSTEEISLDDEDDISIPVHELDSLQTEESDEFEEFNTPVSTEDISLDDEDDISIPVHELDSLQTEEDSQISIPLYELDLLETEDELDNAADFIIPESSAFNTPNHQLVSSEELQNTVATNKTVDSENVSDPQIGFNLKSLSKEELKKLMQDLDHLFDFLPEEKIEELAQENFYSLYVKLLDELGI